MNSNNLYLLKFTAELISPHNGDIDDIEHVLVVNDSKINNKHITVYDFSNGKFVNRSIDKIKQNLGLEGYYIQNIKTQVVPFNKKDGKKVLSELEHELNERKNKLIELNVEVDNLIRIRDLIK